MKILVTGSRGFTASHLLPLLDGDVLDHKGDILSPYFADVVQEFAPDRIYHLAAVVPIAEVREDFQHAFRVNVEGTRLLLEATLRYVPKARVLIVGSSDEYGYQSALEPVRESARFNPVNEYGVTKAAQEMLAKIYQRRHNMDIVFTRTFNFTGPAQPESFVCSSFAHQFEGCSRTGDTVIRTGDLDVVRDFTDIRDVVKAYTVVMEKGVRGMAYNVCSGKGIRLKHIVAVLRMISGVRAETKMMDAMVRKSDAVYLVGDNSRLKELGWTPTYSLEQTLSDLYENIKEARNAAVV
jgi:GDP-4-dehydro-6-deoxy-D-mannose reductase